MIPFGRQPQSRMASARLGPIIFGSKSLLGRLSTPSPPALVHWGAERVGVRWGIPERRPIPTSPSHAFGAGPSRSPLKGGEGFSAAGLGGLDRCAGGGRARRLWLAWLIDADRRPAGDLARAGLVLVAADVEAPVELLGEAVLADVSIAVDLDDRAEPDLARAGDGVAAAADIGSRGGDTRLAVGLLRHRVISGYKGPHLGIGGRHLRRFAGGQGKRQQQRRNRHHGRVDLPCLMGDKCKDV